MKELSEAEKTEKPVQEMLKQILGNEEQADEVCKMFIMQIDRDGDGEVSLQELQNGRNGHPIWQKLCDQLLPSDTTGAVEMMAGDAIMRELTCLGDMSNNVTPEDWLGYLDPIYRNLNGGAAEFEKVM